MDQIAIKLLQGYLWHPQEIELTTYPTRLLMGANVAIDQINPPFAFFDDGTLASSQKFYQITVFFIYQAQPNNDEAHNQAILASEELTQWLDTTDRSFGWSISEDLRPI